MCAVFFIVKPLVGAFLSRCAAENVAIAQVDSEGNMCVSGKVALNWNYSIASNQVNRVGEVTLTVKANYEGNSYTVD